jgi:hypothetical protein
MRRVDVAAKAEIFVAVSRLVHVEAHEPDRLPGGVVEFKVVGDQLEFVRESLDRDGEVDEGSIVSPEQLLGFGTTFGILSSHPGWHECHRAA